MGRQCHALVALILGKRSGALCTGGWVGPTVAWTGAENLVLTGILSPDRTARFCFSTFQMRRVRTDETVYLVK